MICRSAVKPIFVGLGTAAVLAAGGASAIAGAETPSPSGTGSSAPVVGSLKVTVSPEQQQTEPGTFSAKLKATIEAEGGTLSGIKVTDIATSPETPKATITGDCQAPFDGEGCNLEDLDSGGAKKADEIEFGVSIPNSTENTVTLTVTVTVSATDAEKASDDAKVTYVVAEPDDDGKDPSNGNTKSPPKPSPSKSKKSGDGGSSGGSSGGSGGSGGSSGGGTSGSGTTGGVIPPAPNSSFDPRDPQVALPPITSPNAPNPSVAPGQVLTPQSRLQGNKAPVAQDLTFERMASTQVAWLAALMVAFSLLLTQARLGRKRMAAGAAKRTKGTHRRPRHGMFGK